MSKTVILVAAALFTTQVAAQSMPDPAGAPAAAAPAPALATTATPAAAGVLRPDDQQRLDRLQQARADALAAVKPTVSASDYDALTRRLDRVPDAEQTDPALLVGDWSCATTKIGELGLVEYPAFKCRISRQADGSVLLEKLSGSQRVRGVIHPVDGRLVLAGVGYVGGDLPPPAYPDMPEHADPSVGPQRTTDPGLVEVFDPNHARILFPYPRLESTLDVLELTR